MNVSKRCAECVSEDLCGCQTGTRRRRVRGRAMVLIVLIAVVMGSRAEATDARLRAYLGGGWYIPTDNELRQAYDGGLALTAGLGVPVYLDRTWFTLEASYLKNRGQEFADDPTFQPGESRYWAIPFGVGLRFDVTPPDASRNDVFLGLQVLAIPTGFEDPFRGDEEGTTLGIAAELRNEIPIGSRWLSWIRARWLFSEDVEFARIATLPVDGLSLEIGVGSRIGTKEEE